MTTATEIELEITTAAAVWYVNVEAEADVVTGGSYGSDEGAWIEVDGLKVHRPNGKPLPRRIERAIMAHHADYLKDRIAELH